MHFGAANSVLTNLGRGDDAVDPSVPSDVLIQLINCLRALIAENSMDIKPTLILNGDIFEFALSTDNLAAMAFQRFLELAMPRAKNDRLFAPKIVYIPGNHDHHLWESAREIQYANFLTTIPSEQFVEEPWHTTKMIDPTDVPSLFADAVVRRCDWLSDVSVMTVYPNLAIIGDTIEFRIIYLQGKEVGLLPEGHHQSGSAAHPLERATSMDAQLRKGARAEVR